MANSVSIRLGVEGQTEVKRAFDEVGAAGKTAFTGVAQAMDAAGAVSDRQMARFKQLAAAAREAEAMGRVQESYSKLLGVTTPATGAAQASASVFENAFKSADKLAAANSNVAKSVGLQAYEWKNLGLQANDAATMLLSGSSAFQVVATQGGQVLQVLQGANGGISGAFSSIGTRLLSLVSPARLAFGGMVTLGLAGAKAAYDYAGGQKEVERSLLGTAKASGASVAGINRVAAEHAEAAKVSVSSAREMAAEYAGSGKIGIDVFGGLIEATRSYAKLTGAELPDAMRELGGLFSDPAKGADQLNSKYGILDDRTRHLIGTLQDQGRQSEAQQVLLQAMQPTLAQVAEGTNGWAMAWDAVARAASNAYDATGKTIARVVAPTLQDRITTLQARRGNLTETSSTETAAYWRSIGVSESEIARRQGASSSGSPGAKGIDDELYNLQEDARRGSQAGYATYRNQLTAQRSLRVGSMSRAGDPDGQQIEGLTNDLKFLRESMDMPGLNLNLEDAGRARQLIEGLDAKLKQLTESYVKGGQAAAQASRQGDFARSLVGLNSYDRGLREIINRYDELRRAAEAAGGVNLAANLNSVGEQRRVALDTFKAENREAARGELTVPGDYLASIRRAESSGDDRAVSSTGAVGRYQFTAGTWMEEFERVKPALFNEIKAKFNTEMPGQAAAFRREVLSYRTNTDFQEALVADLTQRNAQGLTDRGYEASARNLYGAHNIGVGGISALLGAEKRGQGGASAQSLLDPIDPALTSSNRAYYGNGKTVSDALASLQKKVDSNSAASRTQQDRARSIDQDTASIGKYADEVARTASIQQQLDAYRDAGAEIGVRYRTATELEAAAAKGLTGEIAEQTKTILENANAVSQRTRSNLSARFQDDTKLSREALGRTPDEQAAYQQASRYAAPGSADFGNYVDKVRELQQITQNKDLFGGTLKGIASDAIRGASAIDTLKNAVSRLADQGVSKLIDSLSASLFGGGKSDGSGGGLGGLFGSLLNGLGKGAIPSFDVGGYTGHGGQFDPAGIVHKGEVVFSQADVRRFGGVSAVENIRRWPGYDIGGPVGLPTFRPANLNAPSSGGDSNVEVHIHDAPPGATTTESKTASGGRRLDVRFAENALAKRMSNSQGSLNKAAAVAASGGAAARTG